MRPAKAMSARADALFASGLQRSDDPTSAQVRAAVSASLHRQGVDGCAARVAYEFGEHPMEAVTRMSWALTQVRSAYAHTPATELGSELILTVRSATGG